jgi:hypothetical protein
MILWSTTPKTLEHRSECKYNKIFQFTNFLNIFYLHYHLHYHLHLHLRLPLA